MKEPVARKIRTVSFFLMAALLLTMGILVGCGTDTLGGQIGTPTAAVTENPQSPAPTTPSITGFSPSTAFPKAQVTIYGSGFLEESGSVEFNRTGASIIEWHDTWITCKVPSSATTGKVRVTNSMNIYGESSGLFYVRDWVSQSSGTSTYDFFSVVFLDQHKGWAAGVEKVDIWQEDEWELVSTTNIKNYCIHMANASKGWMAGEDKTKGNGIISYTTNGGTSWTTQHTEAGTPLRGVSFVNENLGWAVGHSGKILHTTNGGTAWGGQASGTTNHLRSVFFVDENRGWAVGTSGVILATTDGGTTWSGQNSGITKNLYSVFMTANNNGWAVGDEGTVLHYTGGNTWTPVTVDSRFNFYSVFFSSENQGWVAGSDGGVFSTSDAGATWTFEDTGEGRVLYSIFFLSRDLGWAVGAGGTITSCRIIY